MRIVFNKLQVNNDFANISKSFANSYTKTDLIDLKIKIKRK